jgi:DNA-binding HxlR family transcriptional regulator
MISNKWTIAVIDILRGGPLRTSELQNAISDVSPKVLTQTLRGMERDGMINRAVHTVVPPRVEYELTDMGRSVLKPLQDLCHWAKAHVEERDAARPRFDASLKTTTATGHSLAAGK